MTEKLKIEKGSGNVFVDLGFPVEMATNLAMRSLLMMRIEDWFKSSGITQAEAARLVGLSQPRFNLLLRGKITEFSLDALVNMATLTGLRVGLTVKPMPKKKSATETVAA